LKIKKICVNLRNQRNLRHEMSRASALLQSLHFICVETYVLNPTNKRHKSNKDWLVEHVHDPYVQKAKAEGFRSRAAYKLIEIDNKDKLFKSGMIVVDLGSAPGSWCQVAAKRVDVENAKRPGRVIAIDLLEMQGMAGVEFLQGDFGDDAVLARLESMLGGAKVDVVLSDMLPNMSGVAAIDGPRSIQLCELAAEFAVNHLKPDGRFLTKAYQGPGYQEFFNQLKTQFKTVHTRKPDASRDRSAEIFLLGTGLK
jgi:23S rRNA (uridine2552-2'-O)-methyltransferase